MITLGYQNDLDYYTIFSLYLSILLGHLDPIFVDHLSPYLSARPIKHSFQPSVSCGSQNSIVQKSSPHKYGQKSNCNAFNAMVAAFP